MPCPTCGGPGGPDDAFSCALCVSRVPDPTLQAEPADIVSTTRECQVCEGDGCTECGFTGERVTTIVQGDGFTARVQGDANLTPAGRAALRELIAAAVKQMQTHVSSCCASEKMSTAGGDGSPGSPCWATCGACGQPCEPVAVEVE